MVADNATSLRRGVEVLRALGGDKALGSGGLGVNQIAELVGADKSQVSRTLKTLAEYGLVDRDPQTRAYRLGWGLFALAARSGDTQLLAAGESVVGELVRSVDERAHLTVLEGSEVLTVISLSPGRAIEAAGWVGRLVPAYCSSSGRALLLEHTPAELEALLGDVPFLSLGPNAPRTLAELGKRIERARAKGYAAVDEEFEPGLVAVAAPVRDFRGRIVAALNVSGPKFRLGARLDEAGAEAARAAEALSRRLGWEAPRSAAALEAESR